MVKHYLLIIIFFLLSLSLFGQTTEIPVEINWTGIETWNVDSENINVITFVNARHTTDKHLPYYFKDMTAKSGSSYKVRIENAVYIPATEKEITILKQSSFSERAEIKTKISKTDGKSLLEIEVHPFIKKDNKYQKLKQFKLLVTEEKAKPGMSEGENKSPYASSSILSQGRFIKLKVTESGIYKLTYAALKEKGLNPQNVRLFGYGGAVLDETFSEPITDDLPQVAVHDTGDALLFYAQGVRKWTYDPKSKMFTHKNNSYSKHGYYFVTDNTIGEKKRIPLQEKITAVAPSEIDEFTDYALHEKDLISIANSGKQLFGEKFQTKDANKSFSFEFPNIVAEKPILLNLSVAANNKSTFSLSLNSEEYTVDFGNFNGGYYELGKTAKENFSFNGSSSNNLVFQLRYNAKGSNNTMGYLDFIELNVMRSLKMFGIAMPFHNKQNIAENSFNRYRLITDETNIQIWEITDPSKVVQINTEKANGVISFVDSASKVKSYVAVNLAKASSFPSVEFLDDVPNQNIHGMPAADMLIITHPRFLQEAERLALSHKTTNGLRVEIVTTEQVYNEFSSGTPDATAYRRVAKFFYDKESKDDKLKYLLLFGKGSFDNRKLTPNGSEPLILTYQSENSVHGIYSYVSDDYFALLENGKGKDVSSDKMDIAVGRFPVTSVEEARIVVQKTIDYTSKKESGAWNNKISFMADDGDEASHMIQADNLARVLTKKHPGFQVKKILIDAFQKEKSATGASYPSAKQYFKKLWNSGLLVFVYMGHAYQTGLAKENLLTMKDIEEMSNKSLPLFIAGACEVSGFDKMKQSIGEELLLTKRGGAIATFSSARTVYSNPNYRLVQNLFKELFEKENNQERSVGELIRIAKNNQGKEINKLSFMYFGDPSLKLNSPTQYKVKTTMINGNSLSVKDTLRALSVATVEGVVLNEKGELATNFNGFLHADVFDKKEMVTSLNNDKGKNGAITFEDYPNTIFSGRATVKEGKFKYSFLLPKNIRYNYGEGRIVHVAWDQENRSGHGFCSDFIVGGSNKKFVEEKDGPEVKAYLNHSGFVNGETVNAAPLFVAKISDISGINITGTGIGQDPTLTINSNNNERYVLNDYFLADLNSYQKGTISFKIPPLPEGEHTISFKVWDLLNNSTTVNLNFIASTDVAPNFISVKAYPNPANEYCYIELDYDSEDLIYEKINLDIFDVSGRLISSSTDVLIDKRIRWDLNVNGQKVPPGIYIYRVYLKNGTKILSSKANKLIIKY